MTQQFPRRPLALLAAGVVLLTAGCSGAVHVDPFRSSDTTACKHLLNDLPATVDDQPLRSVDGSSYAAAYGDPAIVVRCGVPEPKDWKFAWCQTANGIDWYIADQDEAFADQSRDIVMTTLYRKPALEVRLPARYRPPSTAMVDLQPAISKDSRKTGSCSETAGG